MSRLIYLMNVSLDGFVEAPDHDLSWTKVDDELHAWFNDQERSTAAVLYGRRLYETMAAYWPTAEADPSATPTMLEFARIWNAKPKYVLSSTLDSVVGNSRLVSGDIEDVLRELRAEIDGDVSVGGPTLAAEFVRRDLVDVYRLVMHPVVLGDGTPFFPPLETALELRLTTTRRFASGVVFLEYERG